MIFTKESKGKFSRTDDLVDMVHVMFKYVDKQSVEVTSVELCRMTKEEAVVLAKEILEKYDSIS